MRIRTIKPAAFRSRDLSRLPVGLRWTFAGLWCYVDDDGRGIDDPRLVHADLYPLDDKMTPRTVERHLEQLAAVPEMLCRYTVDGERYLHVVNFRTHQRVNRPTPSTYPSCPIHGAISETSVSQA